MAALLPAIEDGVGGVEVEEGIGGEDKEAGFEAGLELADAAFGEDGLRGGDGPHAEQLERRPEAEGLEVGGFVDGILSVVVGADEDGDAGGLEPGEVVELGAAAGGKVGGGGVVIDEDAGGGLEAAVLGGAEGDIGVGEVDGGGIVGGVEAVAGEVAKLVDAGGDGDVEVVGGVDVRGDFEAGGVGAGDDERDEGGVEAFAEDGMEVGVGVVVFAVAEDDLDEIGAAGKDEGPLLFEVGGRVDLPVGLAFAEVRGEDDGALGRGGGVVEAVGEGLVDFLGVSVDGGEGAVGVGDVDGAGGVDEAGDGDGDGAGEDVGHALGVEDAVAEVLGDDGGRVGEGVEVVLVGIAEGRDDEVVVEVDGAEMGERGGMVGEDAGLDGRSQWRGRRRHRTTGRG